MVSVGLAWSGLDTAQSESQPSALLLAQSLVFAGMAQLCASRVMKYSISSALIEQQGIYPTVVIVVVCLQGVAYNSEISPGHLPDVDLETNQVATELEFYSGTQASRASLRSVRVSIGLPSPGHDGDTEGSHGLQQDDKEGYLPR